MPLTASRATKIDCTRVPSVRDGGAGALVSSRFLLSFPWQLFLVKFCLVVGAVGQIFRKDLRQQLRRALPFL